MPTQTLQQGSLRPAYVPAITVVHPGLQVHSITAPKTDRRLSFLMSANLYCAFAAGAVLLARASPAIKKTFLQSERPTTVIELPPLETTPKPPAVVPSIPMNSLQVLTNSRPTIADLMPDGVPDTPTKIGEYDLSGTVAKYPTMGTGPIGPQVIGTPTGVGPMGPSTGQPVDVTFKSVSILRQVQPIYPNLARVAHKEGDVVLIMTINEQGVPTDVKMDSGDSIFKNDAIHAAQQWRFTPANIDGQPRSARFRLTLQFRFRG